MASSAQYQFSANKHYLGILFVCSARLIFNVRVEKANAPEQLNTTYPLCCVAGAGAGAGIVVYPQEEEVKSLVSFSN